MIKTGLDVPPTRTLVARSGEVQVWTDVQGADGIAVVLLMGAGCQAIQWEPAFTDPIVAAGHRVVRFDWRYVGLSTRLAPGPVPPSPLDLVGDVVAVLDRHDLASAHLVGFSMGGVVAELVAALHPERVRSVTALSAPAIGIPVPRTAEQEALWLRFLAPAPRHPEALRQWLVEHNRLMAGSALELDEAEWHARVDTWLARGHNRRCCHMRLWRHQQETAGPFADPDVLTALRERIAVPVLAIHGDEDAIMPAGNADALAASVRGGRAHHLTGRGHDLWLDPTGEIAALVVDHLWRTDRAAGSMDPQLVAVPGA